MLCYQKVSYLSCAWHDTLCLWFIVVHSFYKFASLCFLLSLSALQVSWLWVCLWECVLSSWKTLQGVGFTLRSLSSSTINVLKLLRRLCWVLFAYTVYWVLGDSSRLHPWGSFPVPALLQFLHVFALSLLQSVRESLASCQSQPEHAQDEVSKTGLEPDDIRRHTFTSFTSFMHHVG